jgi:TPR repeat protein
MPAQPITAPVRPPASAATPPSVTAPVPPPAPAAAPPAQVPPPINPDSSKLALARPAAPPQAAKTRPDPRPPALPNEARLSPDLLDTLLRRGDAMLATGDVGAARLLFERAAEAGSARAATATGKTYDPNVLLQAGAVGVAGDPDQAAQWYRRAIVLGDRSAESWLRRLGRADDTPR